MENVNEGWLAEPPASSPCSDTFAMVAPRECFETWNRYDDMLPVSLSVFLASTSSRPNQLFAPPFSEASEKIGDRRLLSNPARGVTLPRKNKKPHIYLSHDEIHALAGESKYSTLILVLAYCGLRWGEAVALRVKDLDMLKRRMLEAENAVEVAGRIEVGTPKKLQAPLGPIPTVLG